MKTQIESLLKTAIKEQNDIKKSTYRSLIADITMAEKNGNTNQLDIVIKANKKRLDAAEIYKKANKLNLYEKEMEESKIISEILPKEPTEEDIENCIRECCGNISIDRKEIIQYVKYNYPTVNGKILFNTVNEYLKNIL